MKNFKKATLATYIALASSAISTNCMADAKSPLPKIDVEAGPTYISNFSADTAIKTIISNKGTDFTNSFYVGLYEEDAYSKTGFSKEPVELLWVKSIPANGSIEISFPLYDESASKKLAIFVDPYGTSGEETTSNNQSTYDLSAWNQCVNASVMKSAQRYCTNISYLMSTLDHVYGLAGMPLTHTERETLISYMRHYMENSLNHLYNLSDDVLAKEFVKTHEIPADFVEALKAHNDAYMLSRDLDAMKMLDKRLRERLNAALGDRAQFRASISDIREKWDGMLRFDKENPPGAGVVMGSGYGMASSGGSWGSVMDSFLSDLGWLITDENGDITGGSVVVAMVGAPAVPAFLGGSIIVDAANCPQSIIPGGGCSEGGAMGAIARVVTGEPATAKDDPNAGTVTVKIVTDEHGNTTQQQCTTNEHGHEHCSSVSGDDDAPQNQCDRVEQNCDGDGTEILIVGGAVPGASINDGWIDILGTQGGDGRNETDGQNPAVADEEVVDPLDDCGRANEVDCNTEEPAYDGEPTVSYTAGGDPDDGRNDMETGRFEGLHHIEELPENIEEPN